MGSKKSTPMWVDPPNPNAAAPPPLPPGVVYEEPEVYFTKDGKPAYPIAKGPGYTPFRDPLPEMPTVYNKSGKPIKPKGVPPGYVPPGANFPPVPKGCQMVNGPKGPTLLCKSKSIATKCDMADGFADGMWFGIPIAIGTMLEAPPLDFEDTMPQVIHVPVEVPVPVPVPVIPVPVQANPCGPCGAAAAPYPSVFQAAPTAAPGPYLY